MKEKLNSLMHEVQNEIEETISLEILENLRIKYLGRKEGIFTQLLKQMGNLPPQERPETGKLINEIKDKVTQLLEEKGTILKSRDVIQEKIDITLPGILPELGNLHPLTKTLKEIVDIFVRLGFQVAEGPEIELSYYNFDALNIPSHHPARDMHDTFYVSKDVILRTHTSPVQIRVMERQKPPLRIIVPGRVYRRDADISHSPMFHQVEGLLVDEQTTFSDLKGVLSTFIHLIFGSETNVRFRPSFFPFTEPSAEVDIACVLCAGKGCGVCKYSGWLEILGAGMVDPEVFKMVNYDSTKYTGFAFGLGVERIAMLKYGINNIRLFFENDMRFLEQF
ncbi:MAG: phenylalanine--tRNA ligase subunit alpha [bacterium]|nr:phenylalanine--tRNA ligase subunit alpha [bacterium]